MLVARVNYSQQKRLKDLERQRKQEEKRQRRHHREAASEPQADAPEADTPSDVETETPDTLEP